MKTILLTCFLYLACSTVQAQNKKLIDSVMHIYNTAKHDTVKIMMLHKIVYEYGGNNPDTAIIISQKILLKSEKIGFEKGKGYAWKGMGHAYLIKGQNDKAIFYFEKAIPVFQKAKELKGLAVAYGCLGIVYSNLGDYPKALEYVHKELVLYEKKGNKQGIAISLLNIGVNYFSRGDYPKALEYFQQSLTMAEKIPDESLINTNLLNVGDTYAKLGNAPKALEYYQRSIKMAEKLGSKYIMASTLNSLGDFLIEQKKYQEALASFEQSLKITQETGEGYSKTVSLRGLGKAYQKMLDYEKSIEYADKALSVAQEIKALAEAKRASEVLFQSYELKGDFAKAFKYHKLYKQTNDSLFNDEKNKAISNLESKAAKAEIEKKELQIQEEKKAKEFQTYILYLVGAGFISVIIFAFYVYRSRQKEKKAKEAIAEQKEEISQMNEELNQQTEKLQEANQTKDKLFAVLGHDLRSPIGSLEGTLNLMNMGLVSYEEFQDFVPQFHKNVKNMQNTLENLLQWSISQMQGMNVNPSRIHVAEIIEEKVQLFTEVAKAKNITISTEVDAHVSVWADTNHVRLLLRNLINNALKFTPSEGHIRILAYPQEAQVVISVIDTGVGISQEQVGKLFKKNQTFTTYGTNGEKGTGLGLQLCQEIVTKNNGAIWVSSEKGKGSTFSFSLPKG